MRHLKLLLLFTLFGAGAFGQKTTTLPSPGTIQVQSYLSPDGKTRIGNAAKGFEVIAKQRSLDSLFALGEKISNKQNSLTTDGTGVKYPTVDAVNEIGGHLIHDTGDESKNGSLRITDRLNIGGMPRNVSSEPLGHKLTIVSDAIGVGGINIQSYNGGGNSVHFTYSNGTYVSPSPMLAGDVRGYFGGRGQYGTGTGDISQTTSGIFFKALENWTSASMGTGMQFEVQQIGTAYPSQGRTVAIEIDGEANTSINGHIYLGGGTVGSRGIWSNESSLRQTGMFFPLGSGITFRVNGQENTLNFISGRTNYTLADNADILLKSPILRPTFADYIIAPRITTNIANSDANNIGSVGIADSNYWLNDKDNEWGVRTGTAKDINFDMYNGSARITALKIKQNGAVEVSTAPTNPTDVVRLVDLVTVNTTTAALSNSDLNTAYPSVIIGHRVICKDISGGGLIYTKVTEAGTSDVWVSTAITTVL